MTVIHPMKLELDAVASRGRALLARGVRAAWEQRLIARDPEGLQLGGPGLAEVEALIADDDELGHAGARSSPGLARLRGLLWTIGIEPHGNGPSPAEDAMVMCLAAELDPAARALVAYLRGGGGGAPTVAQLLLGLGDARAADLTIALAPGAPLRRHRLIETSERAGELVTAMAVRVAPRLLRWLVEPGGVADEVAGFAELFGPGPEPELPPHALDALAPVIDDVGAFLAASNGPAHLILRGARGSGRREVAREAARRRLEPLLVSSVDALLGQPDPAVAVGALLREAILLGAQVLIEGWDQLAAGNAQRLTAGLAGWSRPLLLSSSAEESPRMAGARVVMTRDLTVPATHVRQEIWSELLPAIPAGEIASLYRMGVGAMLRVADGASLRAAVRGEPAPAAIDVAAAVRSEFETDLGTVATRVQVSQTWDDLVVPDDTRETLRELIDQVRHRATVLGRWGFQRKLGRGLGTTALFSGQPGTGKTMVAGLIARELGLELYQIDLSRVMSKWVGETEKNLARLFDAAEVGHVVLLFDEADSVLGKRVSDTKSAGDRHANLETNFILQRLEAFQGVALLTSNLDSAIDPALSRRLSFQVQFAFPDVEQRAELWRRMLPAEMPRAEDIDVDGLAERYELSGGYIRNIALRAAFLAAGEGAELGMGHLGRAAEREYRDHGMMVARGRIGK